ncbi:MAG: hypothetical protein GF398_18275 [Chitinivibrionales bacterium]|nr:hypothetical protein [Chitinivibrionales bacterium]
MNISIFGLGYVGSVGMGCLAKNGHTLIGVDLNETKVNYINEGKAPIVEPEIQEIMAEQKKRRRISATTDAEQSSELVSIYRILEVILFSWNSVLFYAQWIRL